MNAPKCRTCGVRHWGVTHAPAATSRATPVTASTNDSYPAATSVTFVPSEADMIQAAVTPEHECPICGRLHEPESKAAKKQRAYRERHR